ncbi:Asp-tRNA(Asn)/Glu-tRNA(Gln) amidotransferase subunit GatC [Roseivirga misakiensis]|uniref:Aspartyl/glutamyl-tRNA(Asn/Gln) amidotransferase subunit C n=1 Tax=Roseivirga misakiensis TaxID=1563681 RepID=A0A1E5SKK3_9BACT|nr:Asp-tRNA(Asn)/Glu-tRNA(Gln) amidotransferase subunit GatC [Roseivirga misakiensis]OEJ99657.1 asparaginyl/glutamyl-tRNA amidotransferase subunit C [Roseivirga misakiensis]
MKVEKKDIDKIAHLARLNIQPEQEQQLLADMNNILDWVDKLSELDTDGVEPLTHITQEVNSLRADKVESTLSTEEGLKNAPEKEGSFFKVPKVLKRSS